MAYLLLNEHNHSDKTLLEILLVIRFMGLAVDHNVCKKRSFREYKSRLYIFPLTQIPKSFSDMQQTFVTSKNLDVSATLI